MTAYRFQAGWPVLSCALMIAFFGHSKVYAGGGAGAHIIPWNLISAQTVNFVVLVGIVTFLVLKASKSYFSSRATQFHQMVRQAEEERLQAETKLREFEVRLADLKNSSAATIENAKKEAAQMRSQLEQEAEELTKKIREEALKSVQHEVERAKRTLTAQLLDQSVSKARQEMSVKEPDQQRLKNEFVQKIQVVHS